MQVGVHLGYQNLHGIPDYEFFRRETQIAVEAEAMGFDFAAMVEHHFTDYAACPDPMQALSWVAAKTKTIKLMPAAVILPWNDPLRVVEKTAMLDALCEGRLILGMGRGAARREFTGFREDLADSREMFDEAALIIMDGLETGSVEADTKWYQQPAGRSPPAPRELVARAHGDGQHVAVLGRGRGAITGSRRCASRRATGPRRCPRSTTYRSTFEALHGKKAPPFVISDFIVCFGTEQEVIEYTDKYFAAQFYQVSPALRVRQRALQEPAVLFDLCRPSASCRRRPAGPRRPTRTISPAI